MVLTLMALALNPAHATGFSHTSGADTQADDTEEASGSGKGSGSGSGSGKGSGSGSGSGKGSGSSSGSGKGSGSSSSSGKGSSGKSGSTGNTLGEELDGKIFKSFKIGKWKFQPYVSPGAGVQLGTGEDVKSTSAVVSADLGLKQSKKPWMGDGFVGLSYTAGATNGLEIHLGENFGGRTDWFGATIGLTGFYDTLSSKNNPAMGPTAGLDIPVQIVVGPKKTYGFLGVTPTFVTNPDRQLVPGQAFGQVAVCGSQVGDACGADAKSEFFIGNEFSWSVGVGLKTKLISGEIGMVHDLNVSGAFWTPVVTVSLAN